MGAKRKTNRLPLEFRKYFWDVDFNKLSARKYINFILSRILNFGNMRAVRWMLKTVKKGVILNYILTWGDRQLDERSNNFWRLYFDLPAVLPKKG